MSSLVFFDSKQKLGREQEIPCNFISVGGKKFHAVAVALIDQFSKPNDEDDEFLKKILNPYFKLYPKALTSTAYATPSQLMKMLIHTSRMTDLVESMAVTLQQIALDTIFSKPEQYPEVFQGLAPDTSKASLRQGEFELHESALGALTAALGVQITLSHIEHDKALRKREIYEEKLTAEVYEPRLQRGMK